MPPEARSESRKFFDLTFDPIFNYNNLSIHKNRINRVYVKLNGTSNGVKVIYYLFQSMGFFLVKSQLLEFLGIQL
jgi:hypothetical protein